MSYEAANWAFKVRGLDPKEKLVLLNLAYRHNPDHGCFPSMRTIAEDCEISERSARRAIRSLEEKCLVQTRRGGVAKEARQSNRYFLAFEKHATPNTESGDPGQIDRAPRSDCPPYPGQIDRAPRSDWPSKEVRERGNRKEVIEGRAVARSREEEGLQRKGNSVVPLQRWRIVPEDWKPSDQTVRSLQEKGFSIAEIEDVADSLRNYSASVGRKYPDPDSTLRKWMKDEKPNGSAEAKEDFREYVSRTVKELSNAAARRG